MTLNRVVSFCCCTVQGAKVSTVLLLLLVLNTQHFAHANANTALAYIGNYYNAIDRKYTLNALSPWGA